MTPGFHLHKGFLESPLDLDNLESLDEVAFLNVIITGDIHTAFLTGRHFLHGAERRGGSGQAERRRYGLGFGDRGGHA